MAEETIILEKKTIKEFPKETKFKYNWRKYQKRVLDELSFHLEDNHLHIIAPPGSGKTILGLEVALRLNKPTLIFAPTLAIKNQWITRFCELFLQTNEKPDWISDDINNPGFLTVSTYQSLHSTCKKEETEDADEENPEETEESKTKTENKVPETSKLIRKLKKHKIRTIVVDEAHHLKNEWWKSLYAIKEALKPTIVGLTATPPYDVSYLEWQRYLSLNGSVDAEISIPELISENDLCPHQDYLHISEPTREETDQILALKEKTKRLFHEIIKDDNLNMAIAKHPAFCKPEENLDWIYDNLEKYSAMLIFKNAAGTVITEQQLEVIGDKKFVVPELNYEWLELLLTFYIFSENEHFLSYKEHREKLKNKLSHNGLIDRTVINFRNNEKISRFLGNSLSKLNSIDEIVRAEFSCMKNALRMVILTDYIRKNFIVNEKENNLKLNKMGVVPIFEQLRRNKDHKIKLGILSGSLIIIPANALSSLNETASKYGLDEISYSVLPYDTNYLIINITEQIKQKIVNLITAIFENGDIEVLIGTKSLLGEGWDAPKINSLILASFVGSYVLSNQMRGRAIRIDRTNPEKTGNIWHLVCADNSAKDGGNDLQLLKRRFKGFVGLSFIDPHSIENGTARLNIPESLSSKNIKHFNDYMSFNAAHRYKLKSKWDNALKNGTLVTEEIKIPYEKQKGKSYKQIKTLYYRKTIAYLLASATSASGVILELLRNGFSKTTNFTKTTEDFLYALMIFGIIGLIVFGFLYFKAVRTYIKHRDISKDFGRIGDILLVSLIKSNAILTDPARLKIISEIDESGAIFCRLDGGTSFENSVFIRAFMELIGPVDNPRYIIIRKSKLMNLINQKDYHSIPEIIGQKKEFAGYFEIQWLNHVGNCQLVFTRTIEGRKLLLKARIDSLASKFEDHSEQISKWR